MPRRLRAPVERPSHDYALPRIELRHVAHPESRDRTHSVTIFTDKSEDVRGLSAALRTIHLFFEEDRSRRHRARRVSRYPDFLARALLIFVLFALVRTTASENTPQGEWLMDGRVVVQTFDCGAKMCGRILWLKVPRDPQGQLDQDKKNPNPALRNRRLCGLTILWNLQPNGSDRWKDGWFYNPDDGKTYRVMAQLKSHDEIVARIYVGVPLFGKTKVLTRVPHGTSGGWC